MLKSRIFTSMLPTGVTVKLNTENGAILDSCDANIGYVSGKKRKINAILCDGYDGDSWTVLNIVDKNGLFLDHLAIQGAVSPEQEKVLCSKYFPQAKNHKFYSETTISEGAMKLFLDGANLPNNTAFLLQDDANKLENQITVQNVIWSDDGEKLVSHGGYLSQLMLDMASSDVNGDLVANVTPKDVLTSLMGDSVQDGMFDAMVLEYRHLSRTVSRVADALKQAGNEEFFVKNVTEIQPFRSMGVVSVGASFEMSDGQVITVLFNNPDVTPAKITKTDVITSWKWLLNRRDVTAVLQPRAVDAKKYPLIARRMFTLLAKNHERYKRNQFKRNADEKLLNELITQLESQQSKSRTFDSDIASIQKQIDDQNELKQKQAEESLTAVAQQEDSDLDKKFANKEQYLKELEFLKDWLSTEQYATLMSMQTSEDFEGIADRIHYVYESIKQAPNVGSTDGQGKDAIVQLHYFRNGADWYFTELNDHNDGFGFVDLGIGQGLELGYITPSEVSSSGAEIDLYFEAKSMNEIIKNTAKLPSDEVTQEDKIEAVDKAYLFPNATDLFKVVAYESLGEKEGFFASASAIDKKVEGHGASIEWGERQVDSAIIVQNNERIGMIDIASDGKAMIFLETGLNPRVGYFKNEEETPYTNNLQKLREMVDLFFVETNTHVKNIQKIKDIAKYLEENHSFTYQYNDDDKKPITLFLFNSGEIDMSVNSDGKIILESQDNDLSGIDTDADYLVVADNITVAVNKPKNEDLNISSNKQNEEQEAINTAHDLASILQNSHDFSLSPNGLGEKSIELVSSNQNTVYITVNDQNNIIIESTELDFSGLNSAWSNEDKATYIANQDNPAQDNDSDKEFLEKLINNDIDLSSDSTGERLEVIGENLDPELEALFEQAVNQYAEFALNSANNLNG